MQLFNKLVVEWSVPLFALMRRKAVSTNPSPIFAVAPSRNENNLPTCTFRRIKHATSVLIANVTLVTFPEVFQSTLLAEVMFAPIKEASEVSGGSLVR